MSDKMEPVFVRGDYVRKKSGSWWEGYVRGDYSTEQTPDGVCVQLPIKMGPVQIYPASALERAEPRQLLTADQVKELTDRITELKGSLEKAQAEIRTQAQQRFENYRRAVDAEAALAEARKVIEPFAEAADATIEDDERGSAVVWDHPCAAAVDLDDFRRARAWLQANKGDA
jgi:hypothetical protein